jgi:uncharacterized protein (DUF885 family)
MEALQKFLEVHFAAQPEDASTLGVREHATRLGDPSATDTELASYRAALAALDVLQPSLDRDAAMRCARHQIRYLERDGHASNLEIALLPNATLQHALLHARAGEHFDALAVRASEVPKYLARHEANLRRGIADGRAPDRDVAAAFDRVLGGAAAATKALATNARARGASDAAVLRIDDAAREASRAYESFAAFVRDAIVPAAREGVVLGEEEVSFRLRDVMGVETNIDALLSLARTELARAGDEMKKLAREGGHAGVREAIAAIVAAHPPTVADAVSLYAKNVAAATRFVAEKKLVALPERLDFSFEPLPPGIADGTAITNWPAPLLDPEGRGHCLYGDDVTSHVEVATKNLAVHEAIPGHYLQSAIWQRSARRESIVRFLGITDDVAFARGYFGTMLSVEGWAVYMERLLRREGFYDAGPEQLFFAFCDALRAFRVIVDLELHCSRSTPEALSRLAVEAVAMPERWAKSQILRTKRIPLQSLTYLVGALEIENLRRQSPSKSNIDFHRDLLAAGPVPISRL